QSRKRTSWQRQRINLLLFHHVPVRGINGVDERSFLDGDGFVHLANFQGGIHSRGTVGLYHDGGNVLCLKTVMRESEGVVADWKIHEKISASGVCHDATREFRLIPNKINCRAGDGSSGSVRHEAGDAAKSLLSSRRWQAHASDT